MVWSILIYKRVQTPDHKKEKHSFKQVFAGSAFLPFTAAKLGEEAEWVNTRMESTFYKYAYVS